MFEERGDVGERKEEGGRRVEARSADEVAAMTSSLGIVDPATSDSTATNSPRSGLAGLRLLREVLELLASDVCLISKSEATIISVNPSTSSIFSLNYS